MRRRRGLELTACLLGAVWNGTLLDLVTGRSLRRGVADWREAQALDQLRLWREGRRRPRF